MAAFEQLSRLALDDRQLPVTRRNSIRELAKLGGDQGLETLLRLKDDSDVGIRRAIAAALSQFNQEQARAALIDLLSDGDDHVRRDAIRSLSEIGDESVIEALQRAAENASWLVANEVERCVAILRQRGQDEPVPTFDFSLSTEEPSPAKEPEADAQGGLLDLGLTPPDTGEPSKSGAESPGEEMEDLGFGAQAGAAEPGSAKADEPATETDDREGDTTTDSESPDPGEPIPEFDFASMAGPRAQAEAPEEPESASEDEAGEEREEESGETEAETPPPSEAETAPQPETKTAGKALAIAGIVLGIVGLAALAAAALLIRHYAAQQERASRGQVSTTQPPRKQRDPAKQPAAASTETPAPQKSTGKAKKAAGKASKKPAPPSSTPKPAKSGKAGAERPRKLRLKTVTAMLDDFESERRWVVEQWGDPGTARRSVLGDGTGLEVTFQLQKQQKVAATRVLSVDLTGWEEMAFNVLNACQKPVEVAIALVCGPGEGLYYESPTQTVKVGFNREIVFDLTSENFKCERTKWEHKAKIGDRVVQRLTLLIYPQTSGQVMFDNIRLVK